MAADGDHGRPDGRGEHRRPRGIEDTRPGRISCARNVETVRHEALHDRAEVKGLRRRVVAATRLELREA
jgi:hypothetical protein